MSKQIVVIHQEEADELPTVYFNGEKVDVMWICDFVPDDRIYQMTAHPIPKHLLDDIAKGNIGRVDDNSIADAEAYSLVYGTKPPVIN